MSVLVDKRGSVTIVTIDRPEVRNAVDGPTAQVLADAFRDFEADESQLAAVLTGSGGTFCAGADLKAMANDPARGNRIDPDGDGPMGPTPMVLDKPVIAAIEGHAVAGGMELLLWCDLRVAARNATFGFYDRRWGVPLIDGGTVRLPRLIGQSRALDMILTGRPVSGVEAHEMGLVNRLCEPGRALEEAIGLADEIARFPQAVMRADRRSVFAQWGLRLEEAMAQELTWGIEAAATGETQKGAERFASGKGRHGDFTDI